MEERFELLDNKLSPQFDDGSLTYTEIRDATLSLRHYSPDYRYLPTIRLEAALGDIGYIDGDKFIKLDSIRDQINRTSNMKDYVSSSSTLKTDEVDGRIRFV